MRYLPTRSGCCRFCTVCLRQVAVYRKGYVEELLNEVNALKADIEEGRKPVFDNVDSMFAELEK